MSLFSELGYARTTMTKIAERAGLRQPSVYYWFKSKHELLQATAATNRASAEVVGRLRDMEAPAAAKLYRLLYEDTRNICLGPFDYNEIERLAYARPDDFSLFWADYRTIFDFIRELIVQGVDAGDLATEDPALSAATALSLSEGIQKLYRYRRDRGASPAPELPALAVEAYARRSADTTLRSLLPAASSIRHIHDDAMSLQIWLSPPPST